MPPAKRRNSYEAKRISELVEAGHRNVKEHKCRCGVQCLRGYDQDVVALIAVVDIEPIDHLTETLAIESGLRTFDICRASSKGASQSFALYERSPWHYRKAARKYPVLIQHQCRKDGNE